MQGKDKGGRYINASEWFTLLTGSCDLLLVDIKTNRKMVIKFV
jgi:hypothetical protein